MERRSIKKIVQPQSRIEGAGIELKRAFGCDEIIDFDPFLLLDDFSSGNSSNYKKGFPWHPHRGIETITYVLKGDLKHGDSLGNLGYICTGDLQWMTAGRGIIHEEMPRGSRDGFIEGFQLWMNLPSSHKMIEPRYQEIPSDAIPEVKFENGIIVRIISGTFNEIKGPVTDIITEPVYFDIQLPAESKFIIPTISTHNALIYVFDGTCCCETKNEPDNQSTVLLQEKSCVLFEEGKSIHLKTEHLPSRLIYISGKPIGEPIVWKGPIVMNTEEELTAAIREYEEGCFIKQ